MMNVSLTPKLEALVREKVESGMYGNASEVVREAIRQMEERDSYRRLKLAIAEGDAEFDRGEEVLFTPSLVEEMKRDADRMALVGIDPDPDVCP
jgi:antitoxin ParD1/3/4